MRQTDRQAGRHAVREKQTDRRTDKRAQNVLRDKQCAGDAGQFIKK